MYKKNKEWTQTNNSNCTECGGNKKIGNEKVALVAFCTQVSESKTVAVAIKKMEHFIFCLLKLLFFLLFLLLLFLYLLCCLLLNTKHVKFISLT